MNPMLAPYPPDYRAAFAFPSSSYPQRHRWPYGFPTPDEGSGTGLTCSLQSTGFGLGHLCSPAVVLGHPWGYNLPLPDPAPFFPKLADIYAWLPVTVFILNCHMASLSG